ncbi:Cystinosin [Clonorchis sinensis]|uniref:Cystinosin n=2 Tax=Clonorchis sinensis TaxID=79923 RepID=A0A8T1MGB9_CLOSI|nr:Cystinosin [Clonorchis sinensis]GAA53469.1 cystinosin [Clonorchis sinensis]
MCIILMFLLYGIVSSLGSEFTVNFVPSSLSIQLGDQKVTNVSFNAPSPERFTFEFTYRDSNGDYMTDTNATAVKPLDPVVVRFGYQGPISVQIVAAHPGRVYLGLNKTEGSTEIPNLDRVVCDVLVMHLQWLDVLQTVVGWMYFIAWTVSFYPQVYLNWRRKSVVGLNLDFLCLNIVGFFVYSIFNLAVYFSPVIRAQYAAIHPIGVVPVMENDIFFSVHAFCISVFTGFQVFMYERGGQRVSKICMGILGLIVAYCTINVILAGASVFTWLTFLYNVSYVKLFITLIKYIPQAIMNCRRRSTVGWSIGNICLDLTGGTLSLLQMFIVAYNFDDWRSGFGSPTKLGLGLFSIMFDVFFMVQHWCLFRHAEEPLQTLLVIDDHSPELLS